MDNKDKATPTRKTGGRPVVQQLYRHCVLHGKFPVPGLGYYPCPYCSEKDQ